MSPRLALLPSLLLAGSCGAPGLNGAQVADPGSPDGPCFSIDITDGIAEDELLPLFECFNQRGAFEPLAPTVRYLATSDRVSAAVQAASALIGELDIGAALSTGAKLLQAEGSPALALTERYLVVYDEGFIGDGIELTHAAVVPILDCEAVVETRAACSPIRLASHALASEAPDRASALLETLGDATDTIDAERSFEDLLGLLADTSTVSGRDINPLTDLMRFMVGRDDTAPLVRLHPYLREVVDDDGLVDGLVAEIARIEREGRLHDLASDMTWLLTHDAEGRYVGTSGTTVLDTLIDGVGGLDPSMLDEEIALPGSEPTTLLELALDTADDLYLQGADVEAMVVQLGDLTDLICGGSSSLELCTLIEDLLPPLTTVVTETRTLPHLVLPAVYVLHQEADLDRLFEVAELALELDLLGRTRFMTAWAVETGALENGLDLVPLFLDAQGGVLTPRGDDALWLVRYFLDPQVLDPETPSVEAVPMLVLVQAARPVTASPALVAKVDHLLGRTAQMLLDREGSMYWRDLADLAGQLLDILATEEEIDLIQTLRDVLDTPDLWQPTLEILADPVFVDLTMPTPGRGGAWYLYDLIDRGVVARIIAYAGTLLDFLDGSGIALEAAPPLEHPAPTPSLTQGR